MCIIRPHKPLVFVIFFKARASTLLGSRKESIKQSGALCKEISNLGRNFSASFRIRE